MLDRTIYTKIDESKCIGCGLCVKVCPSRTITMKKGKASVTGKESISCGHCMAICPVNAIVVESIDKGTLQFKTFNIENKCINFGEFDTAKLVELMLSRRSCRSFKDKEIPKEMIEDLIKIGISAPSGTNSQKWTFQIIHSRSNVIELTIRISDFYKRLNKLAENFFLRKGLRLIGKNELDNYYNDYYEKVKEGLRDYEDNGKDILFHGATSVILIGETPGASCPSEDALLASQNIMLAAHTMGLGSCLIGFAVESLKNDLALRKFLKIKKDEKIYSVIALGYPNITYKNFTGRKTPNIRYIRFE
ncbi:MAG: nitroreductase family protein [Oligoflexia bacterium]|nr:nitroreductase family protein [Oligoflexia bacterium]